MRSEYCNNRLYRYFKAKSLKLEGKLRHREAQLSAKESADSSKDKEIAELKDLLRRKQQQGSVEEQLRSDLAIATSRIEQLEKGGSTITGW